MKPPRKSFQSNPILERTPPSTSYLPTPKESELRVRIRLQEKEIVRALNGVGSRQIKTALEFVLREHRPDLFKDDFAVVGAHQLQSGDLNIDTYKVEHANLLRDHSEVWVHQVCGPHTYVIPHFWEVIIMSVPTKS